MTHPISDIAFSPAVKAAQERNGSRAGYARTEEDGWNDSVTPYLAGYLETRDSFYLGTANADGQPYIQHRGGPRGFLKVIDERTLAFADFGGNRQFISTGNLSENDKAYIFLMDYPNRRRIKIWGRARVVEDDPALLEHLADHAYDGRPERAIIFDIAAWDMNCPQHITRRFDEDEAASLLAPLHDRIDDLEAEVASLRAKKDAVGLRLTSS